MEGAVLQKVCDTTKLVKMFYTCNDNKYKMYFLKTVIKNKEIIDKKNERLGGADRTFERIGSNGEEKRKILLSITF